MSQTPIPVPAANLTKSPVNVRTRSDADADAELEASILAHGLIQNLVGVPVSRKKGHYRITAGGRRLDAVHRLIDKGSLPADHAIPVLVLDSAKDGREVSLVENFERLPMGPGEECRAFRDIIEVEGKTATDVAKRFGLTERFVVGRLRLANLAEPIFEALENGEITLDVAKAYCTTADSARQKAIWDMLSDSYCGHSVSEIRRRIKDYSYRGNDPRVLLVGRDAYTAAGGRIEDADLYSNADDERWIDTHIVDELAMIKLAAEADMLREREGFAEVRPVANTRVPYMDTYALTPLPVETPALSDEQEQRKLEIEDELAELEAELEDEGYEPDEEDQNRYNALQTELSSIVEREPIVDAEQKASALAYLVIGPDGQPHIHQELYVAPVATDEEGEDDEKANLEDGETDGEVPADEAGEDEARNSGPVMSQRLREMLAMMKTELLAVHVASNPAFALDLGTFIMVDRECRFSSFDIPSDLRASAPARLLADFKPETAAAGEWTKLDEALDRSWVNHQAIADRYDAFCALPDQVRAAWLGWVIARTLQAVPTGRREATFLDHLGTKLEIDVAAWWRPTALTYFDKLTKPAILSLFQEIGGLELQSRYAGSKKHDLSASAERLFGGDVIIEPEIKERALAWLPEAMRFGSAEIAGEPEETRDDHDTSPAGIVDADNDDQISQAA
ncbi:MULTISPECIES: ParB/RepB/Spo0J family partition protein [Sphingobium]|uniref:Chromosome partitioning protein ParB n=1 Tax=Sphingobium lactosutens DS20 TaxID=1331060 RepID=T0ISU0_9SPHN|nr:MULTISPECIES: ParB/RepB/Spo0J family partition protein [Sphingobium]EQB14885.1 chromosome partitioning protein ParB [Sphingobium lactosutens DS20]